jgi:hypothetical protein
MAQRDRPRGTRKSAVEANEEPRQAKLRQTMMQAARFPPEQANICMKHIKRKFKESSGGGQRRLPRKCLGMRRRQPNSGGPSSYTM